ncbi:MAG: damage-control phosphatase ARMT1 family protein [Promethearchaeota archaeon]
MILEPECIGCIFDQIYKALKLLKPEISRDEIIETQKKMMDFLATTDILKEPGPKIGQKTYELIAETLGVRDPYKSLKEKYNNLALEYYDKIKEIVNRSDDPLFEALVVSALGNTIDLGSHHKIDLLNDIKNFSTDNLIINDIPDFKKSLKKAQELLIILDNCGEIVFDKILVETLKNLYPKLDIICSVRAGPIINDATILDAKFIGLNKITKVVEGPATPGVELSLASKEFKRYFFSKEGIILAKGQGNFESLYRMPIPNKDVYYLLKAKCSLMERIFKVKIGSLIFKKKTDGF